MAEIYQKKKFFKYSRVPLSVSRCCVWFLEPMGHIMHVGKI